MRKRKLFYILIAVIALYFIVFDHYGVLKLIHLNKKIEEIETRKNILKAKKILYKERVEFLEKDEIGKKFLKIQKGGEKSGKITGW